jgi:hypothetical protein
MPTQVQFRRGSTSQNNSFTGAQGELTIDTTNYTLRVQDGSTAGGWPTVGLTQTQTLTNKTLSSAALTGTLTAGASAGSAGQYLESTGTGVRWSSVDSTTIANGTSSISCIASGGNIRGNIGGSTITTLYSGGLAVTGKLHRTGDGSAANIATNGIGLVSDASTFTDTSTFGTVSTAAIHVIQQPTLAASAATTWTNAATFYIANAVVGGSNATLTNRYALYVAAGASGFGGDILNLQANGTGNIGSESSYFNTAHVKATSAQYADVAERYLADADYPVGTVLVIGGDNEVTQSTATCQSSVAGTVSENPGVLMNRGLEGEHVVAVALLGRVPCRVVGTINKGDLLTSSDFPGVACKLENYTPGCVIGKALESYSNNTEGTIEIMVGRL